MTSFGPRHVEQAGPRQIFARGDDLVRGLGVGQVAGLIDQDDPAGHGRVPFQSMPLCKTWPVKTGPIMLSKSGTARFVIAGIETIGDSAGRDVHHENRFAARSQAASAAGSGNERLFEAERVDTVVIIAAVPAEQAITRSSRSARWRGHYAAWTSSRIAPAAVPLGASLGRCQQQRSDSRAAGIRCRPRSNRAGQAWNRGR